jgi:hypothetical protein
MKKFIVTVALLAAGVLSVNAQKAVWGVRAGVSRPSLSGSFGVGEKIEMKGNFSAEAGLVMYYSFSNKFYFNPSLMFSYKSLYYDMMDSYYYSMDINMYYSIQSMDINMYCAEVPVYFGYRIPLGRVETYIQAGPYAGYKLGGSAKSRLSLVEESAEFGLVEESAEFDLVDFNVGLAIMYGINIKRFKIEAGYKFGLTNLIQDKYSGIWKKARMNSLFLGVNYVF